ncbi:MAG: alpha/beta fold hydrolase [Solirubrobacterales bacterium]
MASETVNGTVLHYEERGSGPPLLLVHGTGTYADVWSPVLDGLARAYRVIAYDRRGLSTLVARTWRRARRTRPCPVTVIEGDLSDPAFASADGFVMRLLPQARMVSLPGAAHMLHVDQPESWVEIVLQTTGHARSPAAVPTESGPATAI